ncbi:MAG: hypothetical protein AAB776_03390 [Patescibacteria group bacterium]
MRKLAAALALFCSLTLPGFASAQFDAPGSGLNDTAEAAYGPGITDTDHQNIGIFVGKYIIKPVIGLTGLMFLVLTVYAGMMWMTSGGDAKRVEKAKSILVASVTGAVIIASAYVIVNTVIGALAGTTPQAAPITNTDSE